MHVRKLIPAAAALATLLIIMTGCGRSEKLDVQTFNLDYRSGYEAADLIDPYIYGDRAENPGAISATFEAITVRETRDNLEKIGRVLAEFDQPTPGIRLHFQLIEADSFQEEDPSISDVTQELRSLFRFEGYRLLGEATVPVAGAGFEGQNFSQQFLGMDNPVRVDAIARVLRGGSVRLDPVELRDEWGQILETSVNVKTGQTVVIGGGEARILDSGGRLTGTQTLILTVRAETE